MTPARPDMVRTGRGHHFVPPYRSIECAWCNWPIPARLLQRHFLTECLACPRTREGFRICTTCQKELPLEVFATRNKGGIGGKGYHRKDCRSKSTRDWKFQPRAIAIVRRRVLSRYGITPEEYDAILESQNGTCAICNLPPKTTGHANQRTLSVDHNHATGRVRSILCSNCNHIIGKCKEDVSILEKAIAYLRRHASDAVPE